MAGVVHSRMDTGAVPPERRFELFRAGVGATHDVARLPGDTAPFAAELDAWLLDDMIVTAGTQGGARMMRTAARARADGLDYFTFTCIQAGATGQGVAGQPVRFGPHEVVVFDLSQAMDVSVGANRNICVRLTRAALRTALRPLPDLHGRVLSGIGGRIVSDHFNGLLRHIGSIEAGDIALVVRATAGLIANCLAPPGRATSRQAILGLRESAQGFIDANLALAALGPAALCKALHVSRSTLYRAFDGSTGVAGYIRARRLEAAYAKLRDEGERRSLSQIALSCGFSSNSQFSRAFRDYFGYAPRDVGALGTERPAHVRMPDAYARWVAGLQDFERKSEPNSAGMGPRA